MWSRAYDRIEPTTHKSNALIQNFHRELSKEIKEIQKLFIQKLRPSYKNKFSGGKEEGLLDNRSIWKLAAKQDNDFF